MVPTLLRWAKQAVDGSFRLHRFNIGLRLAVCFLLIIVAMLLGNGVLLWQFHQAREQGERLAGVDQVLIAVLQAHTGLMSFYERLDVLAQTEDTVHLPEQIETLRNALLEDTQRTRNALSHLPAEVILDPALLPTLLALSGRTAGAARGDRKPGQVWSVGIQCAYGWPIKSAPSNPGVQR